MMHSPTLDHGHPQRVGHAPIQAKLQVGAVDDAHEREADSVADQVVQRLPLSGAQPAPITQAQAGIQRKCAACEDEQVQRKPMVQAKGSPMGGLNAPQGFAQQMGQSQGMPLDRNIRQQMEGGFGRDFGGVRIHTGQQAAQLSGQVSARAFTHGQDIYFNQGEYQPGTKQGQHLLAHELTHTVQQGAGGGRIQRAEYGGAANPPANWAQTVAAATSSAQKAALIQTAIGSTATVVDKTSQSASDTSPDTAHLDAHTGTSRQINYDDNLNSKQARGGTRQLTNNAGYTFSHNGTSYVVMGPKCIDSSNHLATIMLVNHELDHVRQTIAGSTLRGADSELDAWTSSFIRDFHRSYLIKETATAGNCLLDSYQPYGPMRSYYESAAQAEKTRAITRITAHYNSVIQPNAAHLAAFRFFIRRPMGTTPGDAMVNDLNTALSLNISTSDSLSSIRQFPCGNIMSMAAQGAPTLDLPTFPPPPQQPAQPPAQQPKQSPDDKPK